MNSTLFRRVSMPLSLLILTLLAYWPLLVFSMKFDMLDQYLPWRYLVGQSLQSGHLPFWNPYTHLGYPIYTDPQSGAWYPLVWLLGGTFGYNIYWIQAEFLFHVWIAGCGMFLLTKALVKDEKAAWLAGASYLLSGFFTGNAQHLTWIISGAWIPFVLYYFLLITRNGQLKYSLLCALCFFMLITGGYPAFTIVLLYILIALSLIVIVRKRIQRNPISDYLKAVALFMITTILLSSVMLVSVFESFHIAGRAAGLTRELSMENPFSPQSLLSWVLPFSSVKDAGFFHTDISMSNGYFGLLILAGFILSIFRKKSFVEIITLVGSVFFLIAAMGSYMPLRGWLFDYIPLMNLFRMPSLFRLFVMIGFILLGSFSLAHVFNNKQGAYFLMSTLKIIGVFLFILIIILINKEPDWQSMVLINYMKPLQEMKFNESMILQGTIQLVCVMLLVWLLRKGSFFRWMVIDGVLACWLCAPVTIVSDLKAKTLNEMTEQFPVKFPVPQLTPMINNIDRTGIIGPLWCNLGIWKKQPIRDGYNNFQTKDYLIFESSAIAQFVLKNPIIYLSKATSMRVNQASDTELLKADSTHLIIDALLPNEIKYPLGIEKQLSAPVLQIFLPSKIEASVNNPIAGYFTLLQQYHAGWKVFVDDEECEKFQSNGLFISTVVSAGAHKITFIFNDNKTTLAFYISAISFFLTLLIVLVKRNTIPDP